jgi:hypothetical protein
MPLLVSLIIKLILDPKQGGFHLLKILFRGIVTGYVDTMVIQRPFKLVNSVMRFLADPRNDGDKHANYPVNEVENLTHHPAQA